MIRVALYAMGGDYAPRQIVIGAVEAAGELHDVKVILVGQEERIEAEFAALDKPLAEMLAKAKEAGKIEVHHAPEVLEMDDEPAKSVRNTKDCSINVCMRLVKEGLADAMVSAGNSGAVAASAMFTLGRIKGVARPAIAMIIPTRIPKKPLVLLDAGANVDCHAEWLVQFAIMGDAYSKSVFRVEKPRVGLMSIGTEDCKGNELVHQTFPMLKEIKDIDFIGNIEGHDVCTGEVDVAVCDAFVGNIVLKSVESVAHAIGAWLKMELTASWWRKVLALMLKGAFKSLKRQMDPETYGGAPLLGVPGTVFITHGASSHKGIFHAVRVTAEATKNDMTGTITRAIAAYAAEKKKAEEAAAAADMAQSLS